MNLFNKILAGVIVIFIAFIIFAAIRYANTIRDNKVMKEDIVYLEKRNAEISKDYRELSEAKRIDTTWYEEKKGEFKKEYTELTNKYKAQIEKLKQDTTIKYIPVYIDSTDQQVGWHSDEFKDDNIVIYYQAMVLGKILSSSFNYELKEKHEKTQHIVTKIKEVKVPEPFYEARHMLYIKGGLGSYHVTPFAGLVYLDKRKRGYGANIGFDPIEGKYVFQVELSLLLFTVK